MRYELYHADSYLREMDAVVIGIEGQSIALDQTVFYAQGGGQPADYGMLTWEGGEAHVDDVRKRDDLVWHQLDGNPPPLEMAVHGVLDWEHRYALMRAHTATHILCGVIWRDYGVKVTSSKMEPGSAHQDFEWERLTADIVTEVEQRINAEVVADREVRIRFLPREEAFLIPDLIRTRINLLPEGVDPVRVTEIVGLDLQADGGTHVARTGEVGPLRIVDYHSKGRINKRLRLAL
jgi:misacylated tRNA(Ala) deacylase